MLKRYDQKQQFLLPLNLAEFVSEDHISRVLSDLIDVVDISAIESTYSENGCPAYHPRLFLKILFYGYLINIHWSSVKELFPSPHTLFWSRPHHFLFKPFLSKSFSVYMWIQCLTFIYTHCSFKSSLNSTSMKNYCQQICCLLCEYFTPTRLRISSHFFRISC